MKITNVVVFGAGPHGRVIIDILQDQPEYKIVGVIDSVQTIGSEFYGYEVIGRQNELKALCDKYNFHSGIVGLGDNYSREKVVLEIQERNDNFNFINAISKFSFLSPSISIGVGNAIMPGVVINSESIISNHCLLNTNSVLEHDSVMENFASLSVGVKTGGLCKFGKYSAMSIGSTILDRITIGENVVVGAGSLVTKDLESHGLYYGSPAKRIRDRKPSEKFLK
ncbi:acetyltransferase [Autumnicola psychrophila]|uniref:Acetyltransferase n=1 Tax=Autumnicola psychrophila TaxID=3075592 RepID=A0ABU3DNH0_9FLAO|nr:acetyltransferase [Zunongwangia sp. F225]MDT0685263.1 acetyltransferase [Zunongwangia sp. F225]